MVAAFGFGQIHGAFCLSEPEAGSDATSQKTTAIDMGDHYLVNGTKNWITNGNTASGLYRHCSNRCGQANQGYQRLNHDQGHAGIQHWPKGAQNGN